MNATKLRTWYQLVLLNQQKLEKLFWNYKRSYPRQEWCTVARQVRMSLLCFEDKYTTIMMVVAMVQVMIVLVI